MNLSLKNSGVMMDREDMCATVWNPEIYETNAGATVATLQKLRRRGTHRILTDERGQQAQGGESKMWRYVDNKGKLHDVIKVPQQHLPPNVSIERRNRQQAFEQYFNRDHPGYVRVLHQKTVRAGSGYLTVQTYAPHLQEEHWSINGGYAEFSTHVNVDAYAHVTRNAAAMDPGTPFDKDAFLAVHTLPTTRDLMTIVERSNGARQCVRRALEGIVTYCTENDEFCDVIGKNNFTLHQEGGEWIVTAVDGLHPDKDIIPSTQEGIDFYARHGGAPSETKISMLNGFNTARTINSLLAYTGSNLRLHILPPEAEFPSPGGFFTRMVRLFTGRRRPAMDINYRDFPDLLSHASICGTDPLARVTNDSSSSHASGGTADDSPQPEKTLLQEPTA